MLKCLSLFLPWPSKKTEPQVLYLFFFLSNIHNIFRHCARITWYLINDWQKYWQKLAKDYKTSTLYFHFPRQLARESESRAQPHSPDRDQEKICSLHELVFAIHPCFRVKISDSDAFISFSSLGTWEISHHLHFKVRKQWNRHHSAMLLLDMFPEWLVDSPLFHIVHILGTSLEYVFACFSGIFGFDLETADHAFNLIAQSCPPNQGFECTKVIKLGGIWIYL